MCAYGGLLGGRELQSVYCDGKGKNLEGESFSS